MANTVSVSVSGVEALNRRLSQLGVELGRKALPPALSIAAAVMADAIRQGAQAHSRTGKMAAAVEVGIDMAASGQSGEAAIGFGDQAAIAMHVEYGHRELSHSGADVGHVPAHPFIRPAFDATKDKAVDTFVEVFEQQAIEASKE